MKARILDFYNSRRYAIWWTVFYVIGMWAILEFMFNFDMFSGAHWSRLMRAHLRGFPGFVFGILILAAGPLYVASTAIIARTGKPLITIPWPKIPSFIKTIFTPTPIDTPAPTPADDATVADDAAPAPAPAADTTPEIPDGMPPEMRAQYIHARKYGPTYPAPNQNQPTAPADAPRPIPMMAGAAPAAIPGDLPIPADFDFEPDAPADAAPVFSEINFDMTPPAPTDTPAPKMDTVPAPDIGAGYNGPVLAYLAATGRPATTDGTIVITGNTAIASHTDNDFWIADDTAWFASGKTRPSPISELMAVAAAKNLRPVLYLGATNILDIDARRTEWTAQGITVTTDINTVISDQ